MGQVEMIEAADDVVEAAPAAVQAVAVRQEAPLAVAAPGNDSQALMAIISRAATDPSFDVARLERLLVVKKEWERDEARKAFNAAMTALKAEPLVVFKRKEVSFTTRDGDTTSYKHAELSDITAVVDPVMTRLGLSYRWQEKVEGNIVHCRCIVRHALGHEEIGDFLPGPLDNSGKKNAIQQMASTISYLRRYTLLGALGMSTKGMDDDGRSGDAEGDDDDPVLAGFRAAAMKGDKALRAHYAEHAPTDAFWRQHSRSLKKAASDADADAAAGVQR